MSTNPDLTTVVRPDLSDPGPITLQLNAADGPARPSTPTASGRSRSC